MVQRSLGSRKSGRDGKTAHHPASRDLRREDPSVFVRLAELRLFDRGARSTRGMNKRLRDHVVRWVEDAVLLKRLTTPMTGGGLHVVYLNRGSMKTLTEATAVT